jgi:hypothetical protein
MDAGGAAKPSVSDPETLVASNDVLKTVGVGPAKALSGPREEPGAPQPGATEPPTAESANDAPAPNGVASGTPSDPDSDPNTGGSNTPPDTPGGIPRLIETPIVTARSPESTERGGADDEPGTAGNEGQDDSAASTRNRRVEVPSNADAPQPDTPKKDSTPLSKPVAKTAEAETAHSETPPEPKPENFQLPGSIQITVFNYKGTKVKWALSVIMDNSKIMGRKSKDWDPDKLTAAKTLISRLPSRITPGSRISVHNFLCPQSKSSDPKASALKKCPPRTLIKWDDAPFSRLKGQLEKIEADGVTDPCGAVVQALKNEAPPTRGLVPRLLIVTNGAKKCLFKEAVRIATERTGDSRPRIDVAALGMPRKNLPGYAKLAEKTGGTVLRVERRPDLDAALARYSALLTTPAMDKIEIRGPKANLKIDNGQELTVAPGIYSILLPPVAGLDPAHRTIKDVKIGSGENKSLNVKIVKGKPAVVSGTK